MQNLVPDNNLELAVSQLDIRSFSGYLLELSLDGTGSQTADNLPLEEHHQKEKGYCS